MDFSNVIIMTDLDGTLLTSEKQILDRDMEAIERFRAKGGRFTLATGRGYSMAAPVAEKVGLDMPAVIFNGAAVYDFAANRFLWQSEIEHEAEDNIRRLIEAVPDVGIEVLHGQNVYVPALNDVERHHLALENVKPVLCAFEEIPKDGWLKALVAYPPENMQRVIDFTSADSRGNVDWVRSGDVFYEMLPRGVNKGSGFKRLLKLTGNTGRFTVGMGDYMNDSQLIRDADLGAAVASAQDEVKAVADIVLCDNDSGAMSELISYIERL